MDLEPVEGSLKEMEDDKYIKSSQLLGALWRDGIELQASFNTSCTLDNTNLVTWQKSSSQT